MNFNFFVIFFGVVIFVNARVLIVPDQILEDCSEENDRAEAFDFSEFELIPVNDTHTFINGKWKFIKDVKGPWEGSLTTEKYIRGEWLVQAFSREYSDICPTLHSPAEPIYNVFKNVPGCPAKAGTSWEFDMIPITFSQTLLNTIPSHYMGRWRAIFISKFEAEDGATLKECRRVYADIYED